MNRQEESDESVPIVANKLEATHKRLLAIDERPKMSTSRTDAIGSHSTIGDLCSMPPRGLSPTPAKSISELEEDLQNLKIFHALADQGTEEVRALNKVFPD